MSNPVPAPVPAPDLVALVRDALTAEGRRRPEDLWVAEADGHLRLVGRLDAPTSRFAALGALVALARICWTPGAIIEIPPEVSASTWWSADRFEAEFRREGHRLHFVEGLLPRMVYVVV